MANRLLVRARYEDLNALKEALRSIKEAGFADYTAYGPVRLEGLEPLMPRKGSAVRAWATSGAFLGMASFWLMCALSSLIYKLIVGGKPPVANVPFVIVSYEGTILCGSIFAFIATLVLARLWFRKLPQNHDSRFTADSFGVEVACDEAGKPQVIELLKSTDPVEIYEV